MLVVLSFLQIGSLQASRVIKSLPRYLPTEVLSEFRGEHQTNMLYSELNARVHGLSRPNSIHYKLTWEEKNELATTTPQIVALATSYHEKLYATPANEQPLQDIQNYLRRKFIPIGTTDKHELEADFTTEELQTVLGKCNLNSSPGDDGLSFAVLKELWDYVGLILTQAANDILQTCELPQSMKCTLLL